ncbi:IclR family transcriptional regulator [Rhodococcus ruber]|uniref:IclR family transcriptional regulator n=1 Tax=Rhodococcus ruber TaxID=1830 RepID=UPI00031570B7|nr:IclR family transcriptional regulator [Rhodococcus ruber]AXY53878.1 IclR family transcriptional regulator [Rhodococcus ruber]
MLTAFAHSAKFPLVLWVLLFGIGMGIATASILCFSSRSAAELLESPQSLIDRLISKGPSVAVGGIVTTHNDVPVAVIDRAARLLEAFRDSERLTLAELTRLTGMPRSSTHRLLNQLVEIGWVRRDAPAYSLGTKMLELGSLVQHNDALHRAALPVMHELHGRTGLVVHLAVLTGTEVLYLEKVGGPYSMRIPSRVGGRQPAHCTALGKALLAQGQYDVEALFADHPLPARTPHSVTDPGRLRSELARMREQHVAHERDEAAPGVSCVAAPIGPAGKCVGALSLSGPSASIRATALAAPVRVAALTAWRRFTHLRAGNARTAV